MKRVLKPGCPIVLFETLGTGRESPLRMPHMQNFYTWLDENAFQETFIRTDYQFGSLEEAERLARFFFGDEMGDQVNKEQVGHPARMHGSVVADGLTGPSFFT